MEKTALYFVVWYTELTREPEKARSVFFGKILSFPLHPNCDQIVPKRAGGGALQRETTCKIIYYALKSVLLILPVLFGKYITYQRGYEQLETVYQSCAESARSKAEGRNDSIGDVDHAQCYEQTYYQRECLVLGLSLLHLIQKRTKNRQKSVKNVTFSQRG